MTRPSHKARRHSNWERPRVNGKFVSAADKPPKPQPVRQTKDLAQLRRIAMRLARHLEKMMPKPEDAEAQTEAAEPKAAEPKAAEPKSAEPLPPEYDRLIARNDGVIDSFDTLVHLVIRLIEKEREPRDPSQDPLGFTGLDEKELDRRIAAELDLIASRRATPGGAGEGSGSQAA